LKLMLALCMILALMASAQGEDNYIPSVSGENFWTFHGSPDLTAAIGGTNEFDRGETVTLYVDLINYGRLMGFEKDKTPSSAEDLALADKEEDLEDAKTTAIGIKATLASPSNLIEVKSGDQVVESLKAGDKTKEPLRFTIQIASDAPAGEYPLQLRLQYDYQYNVEVDANKLDSETNKLVGFKTAFWYQKDNQTVTVPVVVKRKADFVITAVDGEMQAGKKNEILVTYKNIGEDAIEDGIARLSIFKPFSSTDDQAFIGNLGPGEEITVRFKLDVDSDATPKPYSINSEIKYTDLRGDTVISESMKIPVTVAAAAQSMFFPMVIALAAIFIGGGYLYQRRRKKS